MSEHPEPLIPVNVDLRDFDYMPLFGGRLFNSDTWILCSDAERVCALRLWWSAWHQEPAGSLPSDDRLLANLAGYGVAVEAFSTVKDNALRGWISCNDGRLYHPVICEIAEDVYGKKRKKAQENANDRDRKARKRSRIHPDNAEKTDVVRPDSGKIPADNGKSSGDMSGGIPAENALKGREVKGREVKGRDVEEQPPPPIPPDKIFEGEKPIALIAAFDEARVEAFGDDQARPFPAANDHVFAERWSELGITVALAKPVMLTIMQRRKASGQDPLHGLKYFDKPVREAFALKASPAPVLDRGGGSAVAAPKDDLAQWRRRVGSFVKSGLWLLSWGAGPFEAGNEIPASVRDEFRDQLEQRRPQREEARA